MASRRTLVAALLALSCSGEDPATPEPSGVTWCQALGVLEASCQRCHSDPVQNGAPFPLVTYDHTQVVVGMAMPTPVHVKMREAVASDFMPLRQIPLDPPVQALTCEQKTTLLAWLDQGAESVGGTTCSPADKTLVSCSTGM